MLTIWTTRGNHRGLSVLARVIKQSVEPRLLRLISSLSSRHVDSRLPQSITVKLQPASISRCRRIGATRVVTSIVGADYKCPDSAHRTVCTQTSSVDAQCGKLATVVGHAQLTILAAVDVSCEIVLSPEFGTKF